MTPMNENEMRQIVGGKGKSDVLPPGIAFLLSPDSPFADGEPAAALENGAPVVLEQMGKQGRL